MSAPHDPDPHDHGPESSPGQPVSATASEAEDTGSRALSEALRSSFFFVKVVMALLVVAFALSGFRIVQPGERAVIFLLGRPLGEGEKMLRGPGAHFALPPPLGEIVRIPIGEIQNVTSTVGWYATTAAAAALNQEPPPGPTLNPAQDGYALTADTNIIHVTATLRYRVQDALAYAFDFLDASNVVQNVLNNAVMYAAARTPADQALKEPATLKDLMLKRIDDEVSRIKLGITLEPLDLRVIAPRQVQQAFYDVTTAEQDRAKNINTARGEADALVSHARSEATIIVNNAEAERDRYLKEIDKFAASYRELLPEYELNTSLFRQRLVAETMQRALTNASVKFVFPDRIDDKLWLQLNREPEMPKPGGPAGK